MCSFIDLSPRPDFNQVDISLRCLDFAWSNTRTAHKSFCPSPLELVARVLIPKADRDSEIYNPRRQGNRYILIEYI